MGKNEPFHLNFNSIDLVELQTVQCSWYVNFIEYPDSKVQYGFHDLDNQIKDINSSASENESQSERYKKTRLNKFSEKQTFTDK